MERTTLETTMQIQTTTTETTETITIIMAYTKVGETALPTTRDGIHDLLTIIISFYPNQNNEHEH